MILQLSPRVKTWISQSVCFTRPGYSLWFLLIRVSRFTEVRTLHLSKSHRAALVLRETSSSSRVYQILPIGWISMPRHRGRPLTEQKFDFRHHTLLIESVILHGWTSETLPVFVFTNRYSLRSFNFHSDPSVTITRQLAWQRSSIYSSPIVPHHFFFLPLSRW